MILKIENIWNKIISRFRSPIVWASLGAVILWVLKSTGKLIVLGLTPESFQVGWNLITGLMLTMGILNNPSDKNTF
jgi:hypothetical protein